MRRLIRSCPPVAPFDAPGWRFVRTPPPVPQAAYGVLGYCVREDRVTGLVCAVPGAPYHPPAGLSGCRYQMGRNGTGYWVHPLEI